MRFRRSIPCLIIFLWTAVVYVSALSNPFVHDDDVQIVHNARLVSPRASLIYFREPVQFSNAFGTQSEWFYRPLFWASLAIDNEFGRHSPEFFHATNILIHAVNGVLLFLLFREWFAGVLPIAAAMSWIALPIHTEAVAWISGRGLSLATLFTLSAALAALKYARRQRLKYLFLAALACSAALLSHEAGIIAPPLAVLAAFLGGTAPERRRSSFHVLIAGAIPLAAYTVLRISVFHVGPGAVRTLPEILLLAPVAIAKYIWWTIWPPPMSMERSTELIDVTFHSWTYAAAWLTIVVVAIAAVWLRRSAPLFAAGFAAAAIALLPFAQILELYQSMAERYVYAASIGIVLALAAVFAAAQLKLRLPAWSSAIVFAVWMVLSVAPIQARIHSWSSEETLYTTSLIASPKSALLHQDLGVLNGAAGRTDSAESYFKAAILLNPSYTHAHLNLANLCFWTGQMDCAATEFKQVLQYDPTNVVAQVTLSNVLAMQGDSDSALKLLAQVVQQHPDSYDGELGLGVILSQKQDSTARRHLEKALQLRPDSAAAAYYMGILEEKSGNIDAARKLYEQALRYRPGDPGATDRLQKLSEQNR